MIERLIGEDPPAEADNTCQLTFGSGLILSPLGGNQARVDVPPLTPGNLLGRGAGSVIGPPEIISLGSGLSMVGRVLSATSGSQIRAARVHGAGLNPAPSLAEVLSFDTLDFDYGAFWNPLTPTRLTFPRQGVYAIGACVAVEEIAPAESLDWVGAFLQVNGGNVWAAATASVLGSSPPSYALLCPVGLVSVNAGDYLTVLAQVNDDGFATGMNVLTGRPGYPSMWAVMLLDLTPPG